MKRMKGFRKMLALVLALMMVFSAVAALAEEEVPGEGQDPEIVDGGETPETPEQTQEDGTDGEKNTVLRGGTGNETPIDSSIFLDGSGDFYQCSSSFSGSRQEEISDGKYVTNVVVDRDVEVKNGSQHAMEVRDFQNSAVSKLNLETKNITGSYVGIEVTNVGDELNITTGNVKGVEGIGAAIKNNAGTANLSFGNAEGGDCGIYAENSGTKLEIKAANVQGGGGIYVENTNGELSVTTTGDVIVSQDGIKTDNTGGTINITTKNIKVSGTESVAGININWINNDHSETSTTVKADSVSATSIGDGKDACGIHAGRYSEIIVDGDVTAKGKGSAWGVRFLDSDYRTDTDESSITVKGNITATGGSDPASIIGAQLSTLTANVTLDATNGKIVSDGRGVFASTAYGQVTANVNKVEGNGSEGIYACVRNSAYTSPLDASEKPAVTVTATDTVTGNTAGIMIEYYTMTDGKTTIAARSDVTATGDAGKGLYVHGEGNVVSNVMTDVLVEGTLSGNTAVCIDHEKAAENTELTVWRAKSTGEGNALVVGENGVSDKVVSDFTAAINYIVKTVQTTTGTFSATKADGSALEKHHDLETAHENEKVYIKAGDGYKVTEAYNGDTKLESDEGGFFYKVARGGGILLTAVLEMLPKPEEQPVVPAKEETETKPEVKPAEEKVESKQEAKTDEPKQEAVQTVADTTSTIATTGTATVYNLLKIKDTSGKAELAFRNVGKYEIKSPDGNDEGSFGMEDGKIVLTSQTGKKMNIGQDGKLEYVIGNQTYEFKFGETDLEKLAAVK